MKCSHRRQVLLNQRGSSYRIRGPLTSFWVIFGKRN